MILIHEDDYISKFKLAKGIANQIADCKIRLKNQNESSAAIRELICLAEMMRVLDMVEVFLRIKHKVDLDSIRKNAHEYGNG